MFTPLCYLESSATTPMTKWTSGATIRPFNLISTRTPALTGFQTDSSQCTCVCVCVDFKGKTAAQTCFHIKKKKKTY